MAYQKVYVKWIDSGTLARGEWMPVEAAMETHVPLCETNAFLISESDESVVVTSTISDTGFVMGALGIPKKAIISIERGGTAQDEKKS